MAYFYCYTTEIISCKFLASQPQKNLHWHDYDIKPIFTFLKDNHQIRYYQVLVILRSNI